MSTTGDTAPSNVEYAGPWTDLAATQEYLGGLTRAEVEELVAERRLLAVRFRDEQLYFPVRQFQNGTTAPGLKEVLDSLAEGIESPRVWATWLAGPVDIEREPPQESRRWWDELADGNVEVVLNEARRDAARWAS